ncbi:MAG: hypothetical protein M1833_005344 [Piccolia ochrophora]|nr:MAG: hypothetical protein M1833_005344 [Piccolia ochrophora]
MAATDNISVLVLGAGELGTAVLEALAAHPQRGSTTVLLRPSTMTSTDPAKQAQFASFQGMGISTLAGDVASGSEDELARLFRPFHTVVGCTGMTYPAGTQLKLARAVLAARVRRYLPWQFGVDYDVIGRDSSQGLFGEQLDVRDVLRGQSATEWVIVSTGMFTSFLFEEFFGVVDLAKGVVRALGRWDNRVTVTTPRDIGRVVAEIVWAAEEVGGVVFTAGDTVSYRQVADVVEKVLDRKFAREEWTDGMLEEELAKDPENGIKKYRAVFAKGSGVAWDAEKTFNAAKGMQLQGVEEWVKENIK